MKSIININEIACMILMGTVFQATVAGDVGFPGGPTGPGGHRCKHQQERRPDGVRTRHSGRLTTRSRNEGKYILLFVFETSHALTRCRALS